MYESGIRHWRPPEIGGESTRDAAVVVRTNSTRMMLQAVREGLGIASLPCCIAEPDSNLERVPKGAALELDGIWLVVHRDVQRTARVRVVIDAIEARLASVASELIGG
jgi:DNA-binding transcriptional LysR family regulator